MALTAQAEAMTIGQNQVRNKRTWLAIKPTDPHDCEVCGTGRPRRTSGLTGEEGWSPTVGTLWEPHVGPKGQYVMTCSPLCRIKGKYHAGPFDKELPLG